MCSSHTEPHVAVDLPVFLERANSLPELSRIGFGAEFGRVARRRASPPRGVLSELAARSEVCSAAVSQAIGSAIPSCRWPFPRLHGLPAAEGVAKLMTDTASPRVSLSFRVFFGTT
jgi:hypothetical protein